MERLPIALMSCRKECITLNLTGVLTLDEEDRLEIFCERCALHR